MGRIINCIFFKQEDGEIGKANSTNLGEKYTQGFGEKP
jgi:hypothetical protein